MKEGMTMKKINEEWLNDYIIELKNIYEILREDSIEYLTGKRSDVLFEYIERGLMLSGMLDKIKGVIAYEKVCSRNN